MPIRVVIDTNVVFEGLTRKGGACGLIIDAWRAGLFTVCILNALAYEYDDVLSRQFSERRWNSIKPLLTELVGDRAKFVKSGSHGIRPHRIPVMITSLTVP